MLLSVMDIFILSYDTNAEEFTRRIHSATTVILSSSLLVLPKGGKESLEAQFIKTKANAEQGCSQSYPRKWR